MEKRQKHRDWVWIVGLGVVRLLIGSRYGLGVDEAHYALYGLRPALSYFDHPPLVGWIEFASLHFFRDLFGWLSGDLLGLTEWAARIPAALCWIAGSLLALDLAQKIGATQRAARWAVLGLNLTPMAMALGWMLIPETILFPLSLWLVNLLAKLSREPRKRDWAWLGVCLGLCGLTKYTSVLFVASTVGMLWGQRRNWPRALASAGIALVMILPVLIWNASHDWVSFRYQTGHVLGGSAPGILGVLRSWGAQAIVYSPFLLASAIVGAWMTRRKWNPYARACLWVAAPVFLLFTYTSYSVFVLPHWMLIAFVMLCVVGISLGFQNPKFRRAAILSILATGALSGALAVEFLLHVFPFRPFQTPYTDLLGWKEIRPRVREIVGAHPDIAVGVPNWTLGSRAVFYLADLAPVFVLDDRFDQFDIWEAHQKKPRNFLILNWRGFEMPLSACQESRALGKMTITRGGPTDPLPVNAVSFDLCLGRR